ncbi:mucin-17 [Drosophila serrata]|uniref:mucin-17 n=1 Tax=Drosophila serrata TaxID=7274 RepID=UPI000A1D31D5|nr:mucin-17 [Drosophila serrata]XP_020815616.1 mucin-17 [Drosophila serrata]XP_020815617.1 mucin-17 [Drosophila serrata]
MSCVRENSPPLEPDLDASGCQGPLSLPSEGGRSHGGAVTSTPISSPGNDAHQSTPTADQNQQQQQQKRRRFHPLRNLRRIFRRRTINTSADSPSPGIGIGPGSCNTLPPPASSSSEKNLRASAAPGSPLNLQQLPEQSYQTQSLPKSKSYGSHRDELLSVLLGKKRSGKQAPAQHSLDQNPGQFQSPVQAQQEAMSQRGVAVFPVDSLGMSRSSYFAEQRIQQRLLRSVGDSSQELEGGSISVSGSGSGSGAGGAADISDSQRSLSEGRLLDVDGDYSRETLSQSHDSVFSESATASSLSIVLKAELTDVLRKRRNRPDASDEDLGLPRSPASPQRRAAGGNSSRLAHGGGHQSHHQSRGGAHGAHSQSEVTSLSLLSVNSAEGDTEDSHRHHLRVSTSSSISMGSDILRSHQEDDVDAVGREQHRLSHAAARHKMAIRPAKKKVPTRQHRMTLETSIPEANEDVLKMSPGLRAVHDAELKSKTRSLPPKTLTAMAPQAQAIPASLVTTKRTKTIEQSSISSTVTTSSSSYGLRALTTKPNAVLETRGESSTDCDDFLANERERESESGFLRRLMHRNSKRSIARANDGVEDTDSSQSVAKKLQISTSCLEAAAREPVSLPDKARSATSHEQNILETRQIIKREIHNEGKHGLNAIVSNYGVHPHPPTPLKPKSGPAARQRYLPKELGAVPSLQEKTPLSNDVTNLLSKSSRGNDTFQSTTLVREQQTKVETSTHFERKPRIVGLSAFQQKLSRSTDSVGQHSSSSNSLETSTDEPSPLYYEEKQRKTVEKARSFRNYQEEGVESPSVHNNMPSLPDLSLSFRVPAYYKQTPQSPICSPISPSAKCVSLGFEINDNKLLQARAESTGQLPSPGAKSSPQRAVSTTKLLVGSPGPTNISQIEQNIDLIVKSPLVSVLRKSGNVTQPEKQPEKLPEKPHQEAAPSPKQRPKLLDLGTKIAVPLAASPSPASPLTKTAKLSNSPPTTPAKPQSSSSSSRRNSSNVEATGEPEFMKIQLNRVDQARLHNKANHLVLAKNLKSSSTERSQSSDDLSFRRSSGESLSGIEIVEQQVQKVATPVVRQGLEPSLSRQLRSVSANSVRSSYGSSNEGLSVPNTPATTPSTPKSNGVAAKGPPREVKSAKDVKDAKDANEQAGSPKEVVKSNRLSLEDRKRLFLSEERPKVLVEQRRKSIGKAEIIATSAPPTPSVIPATPAIPITPVTPTSPEINEVNGNGSPTSTSNPVVLRKKSFASCNGNTATPSKDDPTPELMKVFARRSLKVKDDEVVTLAQAQTAIQVTTAATGAAKKLPPSGSGAGNQSVDSDKENQSNSEEKLDKLAPKYEAQVSTGETGKTTHHHHPSSNRNSVADFRNLNNNNNNNQQKTTPKVVNYLPPIKVSNTGRNSLNNSNQINNNGNGNGIVTKPVSERFSLQLKQSNPPVTTPTSPVAGPVGATAAAAQGTPAVPSKPIERSATVGEFKGIHQRRAEWEQRAKEALK